MSGFNRLLDATFLPPRNWTLNEDLTYTCDVLSPEEIQLLQYCHIEITSSGEITVPEGYITDLASVPRAIWTFISPFDVARAAAENGPVTK